MDKKILIIGSVVAASAAILLLKKRSEDSFPEVVNEALPNPSIPVISTPKPAITLNKTLVLKKGSKGNEVRELQKLLGVTADGDFGANTEAALVAKKGVKEISLNQYSTALNVNTNALPKGTRVMANVKAGVKVNEAATKDNGVYYDSGKVWTTVAYGKEIGTIISISTTKNYYVVRMTTWNNSTMDVWVKASEVVKM